MARLEAFLSAAYIFGPALGGFLGQIRLGLPFIVSGIIAGIAGIVVIIYLPESLDLKAVNKKKQKKKRSNRKIFQPIIVWIGKCNNPLDCLYDCGVL